MALQGLAPKSESIKIFDKLKAKPANKVPFQAATCLATKTKLEYRSASTVAQRIQHGPPFPSVSTCAWTVPRITATWAYTFPLCGLPILTVRQITALRVTNTWLTGYIVWQWDQLRIMKVGGNESATKYFQTHGGSAALTSNDPKVKYTSNAATKYKEELERRVATDKRL